MQRRILAYDASCASCSKVAAVVEGDRRLEVKGLDDREVRRLLDAARPGWRFQPTLICVDGDHVEVFTGPRMATRLVMLIGPRKAGNVVKALGDEAPGDGATRRTALGRGILATGTVLLGGLAASDPAAARSTTETVTPAMIGKIEGLREVQQASLVLGEVTRVTYARGRPSIYVVEHREHHAYTAVDEHARVAISYRMLAIDGEPMVDYLWPNGTLIGRRSLMISERAAVSDAEPDVSVQCGNYCYSCVFGGGSMAQRAAYCAACTACAGARAIQCAIDCKGSGGMTNYAKCMTICVG